MNSKLYELRKKHKMTQDKVAKKAGIARTTYLNIEKYDRNKTLKSIIKISKVFGLTTIAELEEIFLSNFDKNIDKKGGVRNEKFTGF